MRLPIGIALLALAGCAANARAEDPVDVAGTWSWSWKDGEGKTHKHVLDIESAAGKLSGRERFDDAESVKVDDIKLLDGSITFSVTRGPRRSDYKGKVAGPKTINGVVNVVVDGQANEFPWTAERAIEKKPE